MSYNSNNKCYNEEEVQHIENIISSNELPLMALTVDDVAAVLGICKANAYSLCHSKGFPAIKVGKRIIIPKPAFLVWLEHPQGG